MFQRCLFLAANMADDAMRLATTALDGLSDADARRRDANLAAAPPPRRRRRSPSCTIRARDPAFVRTTRRWTPFRLLLPPLKNACPFGGWREKGGGKGAMVKGAVSMNLADDFYPIIFRAIPR